MQVDKLVYEVSIHYERRISARSRLFYLLLIVSFYITIYSNSLFSSRHSSTRQCQTVSWPRNGHGNMLDTHFGHCWLSSSLRVRHTIATSLCHYRKFVGHYHVLHRYWSNTSTLDESLSNRSCSREYDDSSSHGYIGSDMYCIRQWSYSHFGR